MILQKYSFFLLFITTIISAQPQQNTNENPISNGKISGIIKDVRDNKPVEYATISLLNAQDSTLVTGALADEKGVFVIENLKLGNYLIKASFIGYQNTFSDVITLKSDNYNVKIGSLQLSTSSQQLKEVQIDGEKNNIEHSIDKTVFNVGSNSIVTGGSAQDVLRQVPTVNLDQDGNINVRGNGNITVWINGKPSGMTGVNRAAILDQIPASTIEKVELITNPSARYDSEGMGGIINIILKKNRQDGINGSVQVGTGTRMPSHFPIENYFALNKYNAGFSLNIKTGKWNISSNYGYRYNEGWHYIEQLRYNVFDNPIKNFNIDQITFGNHLKRQTHSGSINADYNINDKNSIGIGATVGYNNGDNPEYIDTRYAKQKNYLISDSTSRRNFSSLGDGYNIDANTYYKRTMAKKGQELNISGSFSHSKAQNLNSFDERFISGAILQSNYENRLSRIQNNNFNNVGVAQLDYLHPLTEKTKLEFGAKSTFRNIGTSLNADSTANFTIDNNRTNSFSFTENIYAAYGIVNHNFGFLAIQAGLRSEYTHILGESKFLNNNPKNYQDYVNLFPSVHISKKLPKEQEIKLSFSQRINRPGNETLNPFPTWNNPRDLRKGNPNIRPENVYATELSYSINGKNHGITSTIYYRRTTNSIQRVRSVTGDGGIAITDFKNTNHSTNYGLEIVLRTTVNKIWSFTTNLNAFGNEINLDTITNKSITADIRQMHTFKIVKGFDIQLSGFYMLPRATLQGTFQGFNGIDIGIRKDVLKGKGTFNMNISDILDIREFGVVFNNEINRNFEGGFRRKGESRIITVNFTYKFGKELNIKRAKKAEYNTGGGDGGF